jgi:hypothetical protein
LDGARWTRRARIELAHTFADPDGYVRELAHNPSWTLAEDGSVTI